MSDHSIRLRTWVRGSADDERQGLLGFLSVTYGPWIFDGITLRRTADGRLAVSFPARSDRSGRKHALIRPIDSETRESIERELLRQLEREGVNP